MAEPVSTSVPDPMVDTSSTDLIRSAAAELVSMSVPDPMVDTVVNPGSSVYYLRSLFCIRLPLIDVIDTERHMLRCRRASVGRCKRRHSPMFTRHFGGNVAISQ